MSFLHLFLTEEGASLAPNLFFHLRGGLKFNLVYIIKWKIDIFSLTVTHSQIYLLGGWWSGSLLQNGFDFFDGLGLALVLSCRSVIALVVGHELVDVKIGLGVLNGGADTAILLR